MKIEDIVDDIIESYNSGGSMVEAFMVLAANIGEVEAIRLIEERMSED